MFELSRLPANKMTRNRSVGSRIQRALRSLLHVEELEARVVPTLLGQNVFPADYPWNQNISNAPVAANSAAIIAHIGSAIKIHPDWGDDSASNGSSPLYGIPYNVVHGNSTARVNVSIDNYPGESDIVPVPIPAGAVVEGDYQNGPNPNGGGYNTGQRGDSHLIVWDEDNNIAYELYGVTRPSDALLFPNTSGNELPHNDGQWHAAQESVWDMKTDNFRPLGNTSADAAGLSILAGLVRPDEGLPAASGGQGAINHALRFTLPSGDVAPQYIYPASHVVSVSSGSTRLPFGARLRLMNTPAVNTVINGLGPQAQIIAYAMQQYGLVLADIGSAMYVTGTSASEDANNSINQVWNMTDVLGLRGITAGMFDVVNLTPQVTGLSVNNGAAGNTITVIGQNFSGAAGHLTVKFGAVVSTSVTYLDDSHITAVVPNGSGTVNVQVTSGVNATDPNNPSDNVNNPIFGYGTSPIVAADQFAYSGQAISGTSSTASFAGSTVASGSSDVLTIVVKDTTGSAVGGLTNGAFGFTLSGGASAGTFGSVTETATAGTYTATFTGTSAGTASTVTVNVAGVNLVTQPSITVTPGPVNAANSTASFAVATVSSGSSDALTIVVKDSFGNAIGSLNNSAFGFSLSGGTSTGSFGTVTQTATAGTYTVLFTGGTAGTGSTLTVTVSGVALTSRPTIRVIPVVSAGNSTATFAKPTVAVGKTDTLTIAIKDTLGNAISGLGNSAFTLALSGGTSTGTFGAVTESSTPGTYTAIFTGTVKGTVSALTVTVSGVVLTSKPNIQVVSPHKLYVAAVYQTVLGRPADASSLDYWTNVLDADPSQRAMFVNSLDHSAEYFATIITPAYQRFLGRAADAAGLAFWVSQMQQGLTDEQLEAGFIGSPEFYSVSGGTDKSWVDAMYQQLLGRPADATGETFWTQQLQRGQLRSTVALGFAASAERESQHITLDYQTYLGRTPDAAGLSYWLDQFLHHGQTNENLITGFLASDEYFNVVTS
jgi:hypothetical protein